MAILTIPTKKEVVIRCYCHGFGDCFLLAFRRAGTTTPFYVVIDCGILAKSKDATARMRAVVNDINEATNGNVHLLIITHEHEDHVIGFRMAKEEWAKIQVDEVWAAWTEAADTEAKLGVPGFGKKIKKPPSIHEAREKLIRAIESLSLNTRAVNSELQEKLEMFGATAKFANTVREGRNIALGLSNANSFCEPGEVRKLPGTSVQALVLGPPKDTDALFDDEGGAGDHFSHLTSFAESLGFKADLAGLAFGLQPFSASDNYRDKVLERLGIPKGRIKADRWDPFGARYHFVPGSDRWTHYLKEAVNEEAIKRYSDKQEDWRMLGSDAAVTIEGLALQLTDFVNNLSLALAFRLKSGKYLLFPADAQAGNWKSWGNQDYTIQITTTKQEKVTIEHVLQNTVFCKAGHHGSHNGTLIPDRFELIQKSTVVFVPFEYTSQWPKIPAHGFVDYLKKNKMPFAMSEESQVAKPPFHRSAETIEANIIEKVEESGGKHGPPIILGQTMRPLYVQTSF